MNLIDGLMKTSLTKNESELYIALSREGELTGYEAAKITGIPRANTYQALAALVDKGGAYVVEGDPARYIAVPVEEYCDNIMYQLKEVTDIIKKECPILRKPSEPYVTITGIKHIVNKMKNIINNAKERVYISMSEAEAPYVKSELENAVSRGIKVVAIISGNLEIEGAKLHTICKTPGQVRLIADSAYVLTGSIALSDTDSCLYSKNKPLVELIKDSLKNEIRLAMLKK
ncbi:MAG: helix-turn-helix domain-containing protein [Bacillota bacterium]|nr:helix-turn-helix domain-containing protein [Bacillota bacterium]